MRYFTAQLIICSIVLVSACGTSPGNSEPSPPAYEIDGIRIRNELNTDVTDVQTLVPRTGDFVSCGTVLAGTSCSTSFPGRAYRGNPVQITWKEQGQQQGTAEFTLDRPETLDPAVPAWIEVVIFSPGQAGARMVQDPR